MLPTFETERLIVRLRDAGDLEACLAMDRDPEVTKFIPGPWQDPDAHRAFVTARIFEDFGAGLGYWSIVAKEAPSTFLGWILLIPDDTVGPDIEVGWRLTRATWGRGIAAEAARPVIAHAFGTLGLDRIIANIHPDNLASRKLAEKLGLRHQHDQTFGEDRWAAYEMTHADHAAIR